MVTPSILCCKAHSHKSLLLLLLWVPPVLLLLNRQATGLQTLSNRIMCLLDSINRLMPRFVVPLLLILRINFARCSLRMNMRVLQLVRQRVFPRTLRSRSRMMLLQPRLSIVKLLPLPRDFLGTSQSRLRMMLLQPRLTIVKLQPLPRVFLMTPQSRLKMILLQPRLTIVKLPPLPPPLMVAHGPRPVEHSLSTYLQTPPVVPDLVKRLKLKVVR